MIQFQFHLYLHSLSILSAPLTLWENFVVLQSQTVVYLILFIPFTLFLSGQNFHRTTTEQVLCGWMIMLSTAVTLTWWWCLCVCCAGVNGSDTAVLLELLNASVAESCDNWWRTSRGPTQTVKQQMSYRLWLNTAVSVTPPPCQHQYRAGNDPLINNTCPVVVLWGSWPLKNRVKGGKQSL